MAPNHSVCCPNGNDPLSVHGQCFHRCSAFRGHTDDLQAIGGPNKMILPQLSTGIEERHCFPCNRIDGLYATSLAAIAVKAGKSQVIHVIRTALAEWNDMINGKADILPLLGSVAVFAKLAGSLAHQALVSRRNLTPNTQALFSLWTIIAFRVSRLIKLRKSSISS